MAVHVNVDNFVRADTDRMFAGLQRDSGGVNVLSHNRAPASVDHQTVIRMNPTRCTASPWSTSARVRRSRFPNTVRLYRPRPEILDGTWAFPTIDAT